MNIHDFLTWVKRVFGDEFAEVAARYAEEWRMMEVADRWETVWRINDAGFTVPASKNSVMNAQFSSD